MHVEQQRYWVSLLNLQRGWPDDEAALRFVPPRHRDFRDPPAWPARRAVTYLLNNLELLRESHRRLEAGEPLDWALLNHGLGQLQLRLHPWPSAAQAREAARARHEVGGRLETLQVTTDPGDVNPGTRYIRATVERSLYYFATYVDDRLSDPAYPDVSPDRWHVAARAEHGGDLVLVPPQAAKGSGSRT